MLASPKYSIVVAMYNVERYVPSFLDSILSQTIPIEMLEVLVIDDGSTDESVSKVESWSKKHKGVLKIYRKTNGGPGSARNLGMKHARGEWVTFCDPDDVLDSSYFSEVDAFLQRDSAGLAQMLTSRLVQHEDGTIKVNHKHPLDWKFQHGTRLVNLNEKPNHVQLSGGTTFLKLEVIEKFNLTFDERIRPKFEDANFIGRYLAVVPEPIVGIVAKARYYYRKRSDGSSLVQGAWGDPRAYSDVPTLGYLGLLQFANEKLGYVPTWAQYMVLYDLVWMHAADKAMHSEIGSITAEQQQSMLTALDHIMILMDKQSISDFSATGMGWTFYNILLHHYKTPSEPTPVVIEWATDETRGIRKMSYMFVGSLPSEETIVDGVHQDFFSEKVIAHSLFGRVMVRERSFTVPDGSVQIFLNGRRARITKRTGLPNRKHAVLSDDPRLQLLPAGVMLARVDRTHRHPRQRLGGYRTRLDGGLRKIRLQSQLTGKSQPVAAADAARRLISRRLGLGVVARDLANATLDAAVIQKSRENHSASKYRNAWVFLDRKDRADDNAEHLYKYVSNSTKENAWFLLERTSSDWDRLTGEGFNLVEYGSDESVLLVLNAAYIISSHADRDIQYPIDQTRFGRSKAKIIFLQHGVTKDDLSRWINGKNLALMITASVDEHKSIVGHDNPYKWGESTIRLTGFPRHDELFRKTELVAPGSRTSILIAPTWRQYVTTVMNDYSSIDEKVQHFRETEFGRNWLALLNDDRLRKLSTDQGIEVNFLGHPNLSEIVAHLDLPSHIHVLSYDDIGVQDTLVGSGIVISDYSSLAFDAAISGANVIHFQFDGNEIYKGGHVYRKGYFDYSSSGFGNVFGDSDGVANDILRIISNGFNRDAEYTARVSSAFPFQDKLSCLRVFEAIKNLERSWRDQVAIDELR